MFFFRRNLESLTDAELLRAYRKSGNKAIIGELFKRYTHLVFGVSLKYLKNEADAQDAAMEIFELLIEKLRIHDVNRFNSWLYTVTRNHCLMRLRSAKRRSHLNQLYVDSSFDKKEIVDFDELPHPDNIDENAPDIEALYQGLDALKEGQRICLELFFLEGRRYQEIVETTGYSLKQVKSHIQNGKRNLKNKLDDKE